MRVHRIAVVAACVAFAIAGCSKKNEAPDSPLAYVPADTPYVFGAIETVPKDVMDAWATSFAAIGPFYEATLDDMAAKFAEDGDQTTPARVILAIREEMKGKYSLAGLESIGLTPFTRNAFYGIGAVPVGRVELKDPAAFEAFVGRIEGRVGEKLPRGTVGEQAYWRVGPDEGKLNVIVAVQGKQLVVTLAPKTADDALLRQLLGIDLPAERFDADQLAAFNKEHGYLPYGSGYVDTVKLVNAVIDRRTDVERAFITALDIKDDTTSPACKAEFNEIAARMPRLTFGYDSLEAKRMDIRGTLEFDAALAAELKALTAPVPGLGAESTAMMMFGLSFDLAKVAQFVEARAAAVEAKPYTCEGLANLNTGWADLRQQVGNPMVFAMAPALKGLHVALTKLEMTTAAPPVIAGKVVIASDNPKALLQLVGNMVPALNTLPLTPGGAPVPLPAELAPPGVPPTHVAIVDKALGIAVGPGEEASLVDFISAPAGADQPFFAVGYSGEFFKSMGQFTQSALAMEPDPAKRAAAERNMQMMQDLYGNSIRHLDVVVVFTDRGAEFREIVTLK